MRHSQLRRLVRRPSNIVSANEGGQLEEIFHSEYYNRHVISTSKRESNFLINLNNATWKPLVGNSDVSVVTMNSEKPTSEYDPISADKLFVRNFYPRLLAAIRERKRVVLLGNDGVGKSFFQYYYMMALVNPAACGLSSLPPDESGSRDPPEVIVRQFKDDEMIVYWMAKKVAHDVKVSARVLNCFHGVKMLYLYEPFNVLCEPLSCPSMTLVTTSNPVRYKEFCRQEGALKFYMPSYELEELLDVGRYLRTQPDVMKSPPLVAAYSDCEIEKRFREFGGIYRHVLPRNLDVIDDYRSQRRTAIFRLEGERLLLGNTVEDPGVDDFLAHYVVEKNGTDAFVKTKIDIIPSVVPLIHKRIWDVDSKYFIQTLMNNELTGAMDSACPFVFQHHLKRCLMSGVEWELGEQCDSGVI